MLATYHVANTDELLPNMSITIAPFPKDSSNGFSILITAEAKPGKADAFLDILQRVRSDVMAEPGCVLFEVFRTDENPNKFVWFETWTITVESFMQVREMAAVDRLVAAADD